MSESTLMTIEQAKRASFGELAKNIRVNIEAASQPGGGVLDNRLLLELLDILEQKIGGRRPELPPQPAKPYDPEDDRLPPPNPTPAQLEAKKRLKQQIEAAERMLKSKDEHRRTKIENRLEDLRRQLEDLTFKIRISGLPPWARQRWLWSRESIPDLHAKLAEYRAQMAQYEKDTPQIQRAIEQWDSLYGGNPDYFAFLKIIDHLRADVESYVRGEFVLRSTKLPWRFLPPGHRDVSWIIDEISRLNSRYPHLKLDEERLRYAHSLKPSQVFVGEDEFDGYFAFVFPSTKHVLLESPQEGNAAYIFQQNWTSLSRRTKQELLSSYTHCVKRVLHRENSDWKWEIRRRLGL